MPTARRRKHSSKQLGTMMVGGAAIGAFLVVVLMFTSATVRNTIIPEPVLELSQPVEESPIVRGSDTSTESVSAPTQRLQLPSVLEGYLLWQL